MIAFHKVYSTDGEASRLFPNSFSGIKVGCNLNGFPWFASFVSRWIFPCQLRWSRSLLLNVIRSINSNVIHHSITFPSRILSIWCSSTSRLWGSGISIFSLLHSTSMKLKQNWLNCIILLNFLLYFVNVLNSFGKFHLMRHFLLVQIHKLHFFNLPQIIEYGPCIVRPHNELEEHHFFRSIPKIWVKYLFLLSKLPNFHPSVPLLWVTSEA